ncbi:hypothetical protein PPEP_b0667 [Pseudoalteromonas peptidolytica F12-50-A1]|uniref:Uncharacterized protein n=1 Tax=Pseudoalteromonas peptidolytica F12-50-A1 TaxID=1315280 RepID=A0A8I0T6U2_9GAMM|nr:hypothetical protein [Pseudoalteromonas peptidolytica F12-50-A1]
MSREHHQATYKYGDTKNYYQEALLVCEAHIVIMKDSRKK